MADELLYDGKELHWKSPGDGKPAESYKATSGLPGHQVTADQCVKDHGPIPEGTYTFTLRTDPDEFAKDDGRGVCNLRASWKIQRIPRGADAGACEPYWANWGENRIRIEPADKKTKNACSPRRSGFYLHDSRKGYSHGCIEIEGRFFTRLREYAQKKPGRSIQVVVDYAFASTYGATDR